MKGKRAVVRTAKVLGVVGLAAAAVVAVTGGATVFAAKKADEH